VAAGVAVEKRSGNELLDSAIATAGQIARDGRTPRKSGSQTVQNATWDRWADGVSNKSGRDGHNTKHCPPCLLVQYRCSASFSVLFCRLAIL